MLHVISAQSVARDVHTVAPGPLERTCWKRSRHSEQIVKTRFVPLNEIPIILLLLLFYYYSLITSCASFFVSQCCALPMTHYCPAPPMACNCFKGQVTCACPMPSVIDKNATLPITFKCLQSISLTLSLG